MDADDFHSVLTRALDAFDQGRLDLGQLMSEAQVLTSKHYPESLDRAERWFETLKAVKFRYESKLRREGRPSFKEKLFPGSIFNQESHGLHHEIVMARQAIEGIKLDRRSIGRLQKASAREEHDGDR